MLQSLVQAASPSRSSATCTLFLSCFAETRVTSHAVVPSSTCLICLRVPSASTQVPLKSSVKGKILQANDVATTCRKLSNAANPMQRLQPSQHTTPISPHSSPLCTPTSPGHLISSSLPRSTSYPLHTAAHSRRLSTRPSTPLTQSPPRTLLATECLHTSSRVNPPLNAQLSTSCAKIDMTRARGHKNDIRRGRRPGALRSRFGD